MAACLLLAVPAVAIAQRFSFGVIGGTNLTRDYESFGQYFLGDLNDTQPSYFGISSDAHGFIFGPTFEARFSRGFALEIDALHRNLTRKGSATAPGGFAKPAFQDSVGTWEWPVLLKYRVPSGRCRPFIEAGPSFRTRKNPGATEPSQFGATLGGGVELRAGRVRFSPTLRYTRWQRDPPYPTYASKRDQLEFLTGVSYDVSAESMNLGGGRLRFGVIGGAHLTGGLRGIDVAEEQGYAAGLQIEYEFTSRLSVAGNGIYRPLRGFSLSYFEGRTFRYEFTVLTWEFPVLAKYVLKGQTAWKPLIEGGPSFRASGNLNGYSPSGRGVTAGLGFETVTRRIKVAPRLRYTRWASETLRYSWMSRTRQDEVQFLVGVSF